MRSSNELLCASHLVFTPSKPLLPRSANLTCPLLAPQMTLPVAVLAALTASAAAALTPSHGYAASFAGGRPIAAAVWRDGAHQDLQFLGMSRDASATPSGSLPASGVGCGV